ncbi:MAG: glycosyltransferase family protein [Ferruginibacter sp.]
MKEANFNTPGHNPRILVAPLDWGLGHATRCIPVISALIKQHCTVIVAAEGRIKVLLQKEFPDLQFIELKGYRVRYSRSKFRMPVKLLFQLPGIIYRIYAENRWLKKITNEYNIDAVISDNRMGLHHKKIPCVYITHQLTIKTGSRFTERIAQKIHYHFINKFSECWVPDKKGTGNLAGELSHPAIFPRVPVTYIGTLSRFDRTAADGKYDLCIILSGPEPQRTVFEKIILSGIDKVRGKIILVRGLPEKTTIPVLNNPSVEMVNHLTAKELNIIMLQSAMIISRCGYSTVMDLVKLQKKAILVPTPGQTEQEYLAAYLQDQKLFYSIDQANFSLPAVLKRAADLNYNIFPETNDDYKMVVDNFVVILTNNAGT